MRGKRIEENKKVNLKDNIYIKRAKKVLKIVLLIVMITLMYMASDRLGNYIKAMSITDLKIIINLVFAVTAMYIYKK